MKTHLSNPNLLPDDMFIKGELRHLVVGNECRLLDRRRTPGRIVQIDMDGGFFRWEISDFEDAGKFWDVAFERVGTYQFKTGSRSLDQPNIDALNARIRDLDQTFHVEATAEVSKATTRELNSEVQKATTWLNTHSEFFKSGGSIDFQSRNGPLLLRSDLSRFMADRRLDKIEQITTEVQVLNPQSGDWIKGLQIVMAEMGLKPYQGKRTRSSKAFEGVGSRTSRVKYILQRMAFIRAVFKKLHLDEVELYRGMSTEWSWQTGTPEQYRFWSSWTFNRKVAEDFTDFTPGSRQKNSYLIKRAIPVEKLFMTFLETGSMNRQYSEAEAIVLHDDFDRLLW